jgi:hypothetical protein
MSDLLAGLPCESLGLADYYREFEQHFWSATSFWKLERGQSFAEPGNDSWEAFSQGRWDESLRILEAERPAMRKYQQRIANVGFTARRVRIVELPLSPYLQWELHSLAIRDECGGPVRIVQTGDVAEFEDGGALPEICTISDEVMYQAIYDENGVLAKANRFQDRDGVRRCRDFIAALFNRAEPLAKFFRREVVGLAPPAGRLGPAVTRNYLEQVGRPLPLSS